jgi:hypothetical protein
MEEERQPLSQEAFLQTTFEWFDPANNTEWSSPHPLWYEVITRDENEETTSWYCAAELQPGDIAVGCVARDEVHELHLLAESGTYVRAEYRSDVLPIASVFGISPTPSGDWYPAARQFINWFMAQQQFTLDHIPTVGHA